MRRTEARVLKLGLLLVLMGATAAAVGGGLIVYSQTRSESADLLDQAFQQAKASDYLPIVARVNGEGIRGETVAFYVILRSSGVSGLPEGSQPEAVPSGRDVLDALIDDELAYQEATRRAVVCSQAEVERLAAESAAATPADVLEVFASALGTTTADFATAPVVVDGYAKQCALGRLREAVTPVEARNDLETINRVWDQFRQSLRAGATIEVLDTQLR